MNELDRSDFDHKDERNTIMMRVNANDFDATLRCYKQHVFYARSLDGIIFNDKKKRFEDGTRITTSTVVRQGEGWVQTLNTLYKLEKPLEEDSSND